MEGFGWAGWVALAHCHRWTCGWGHQQPAAGGVAILQSLCPVRGRVPYFQPGLQVGQMNPGLAGVGMDMRDYLLLVVFVPLNQTLLEPVSGLVAEAHLPPA